MSQLQNKYSFYVIGLAVFVGALAFGVFFTLMLQPVSDSFGLWLAVAVSLSLIIVIFAWRTKLKPINRQIMFSVSA